MKYAQMKQIQSGLVFKSVSGIKIKTTGISVYIPSQESNVHEVEIIEGQGAGSRYLHNLDKAELMTGHAAAA